MGKIRNPLTDHAMHILSGLFTWLIIGILALALCLDWGAIVFGMEAIK